MSAISNYLEQEILEHVFKNTAIFAPLASTFVGLATVAPTDSSFTEVLVATDANYARQTVAAAAWTLETGVEPMRVSNLNDITFPAVAAAAGYTVNGVGLFDVVTAGAGNRYFQGTISKALALNDQLRFAGTPTVPGNLQVTLT
jgi:hypothetical protein